MEDYGLNRIITASVLKVIVPDGRFAASLNILLSFHRFYVSINDKTVPAAYVDALSMILSYHNMSDLNGAMV